MVMPMTTSKMVTLVTMAMMRSMLMTVLMTTMTATTRTTVNMMCMMMATTITMAMVVVVVIVFCCSPSRHHSLTSIVVVPAQAPQAEQRRGVRADLLDDSLPPRLWRQDDDDTNPFANRLTGNSRWPIRGPRNCCPTAVP